MKLFTSIDIGEKTLAITTILNNVLISYLIIDLINNKIYVNEEINENDNLTKVNELKSKQGQLFFNEIIERFLFFLNEFDNDVDDYIKKIKNNKDEEIEKYCIIEQQMRENMCRIEGAISMFFKLKNFKIINIRMLDVRKKYDLNDKIYKKRKEKTKEFAEHLIKNNILLIHQELIANKLTYHTYDSICLYFYFIEKYKYINLKDKKIKKINIIKN
jgi:hypothetical protein